MLAAPGSALPALRSPREIHLAVVLFCGDSKRAAEDDSINVFSFFLLLSLGTSRLQAAASLVFVLLLRQRLSCLVNT